LALGQHLQMNASDKVCAGHVKSRPLKTCVADHPYMQRVLVTELHDLEVGGGQHQLQPTCFVCERVSYLLGCCLAAVRGLMGLLPAALPLFAIAGIGGQYETDQHRRQHAPNMHAP